MDEEEVQINFAIQLSELEEKLEKVGQTHKEQLAIAFHTIEQLRDKGNLYDKLYEEYQAVCEKNGELERSLNVEKESNFKLTKTLEIDVDYLKQQLSASEESLKVRHGVAHKLFTAYAKLVAEHSAAQDEIASLKNDVSVQRSIICELNKK